MIDINLLPVRNVLTQKEKKLRSHLIIIAGIVGAVLSVVFVTLFITNQYLFVKRNSLKTKKADLQATFEANSSTIINLGIVRDKLTGIKLVNGRQVDMPEIISKLLNLISIGTEVKTLQVEESGKVDIVASSPKIEQFTELISKIGRAHV